MSYETPRRAPLTSNGWPKGIDNLRRTYNIDEGFLRDAINVDISNSGKVRRRAGYGQVFGGSQCHSLFATPDWLAYVSAGVFTTYNPNHVAVGSRNVNPLNHFAFQEVNGVVYCTNYIDNFQIDNTGAIADWGVPNPTFNPTATATAGALDPGTYQITITYTNAVGEESGATIASLVTLAATGGILLSGFPAPPAQAVNVRVYCSYTNGGELYRYGEYPAATNLVLLSSNNLGPALRTQFLSPIPPGSDIAYTSGALFVADGQFVYYTQPLRYGLYNNTGDFLWMPKPVKLIWGAYDGLYVATEDQTYFVTGMGSPEQTQKIVLPYGAVPGTKAETPDKTSAMWVTPKGIVKATIGGNIENISYDKISLGDYQQGAAVIREDDGLRRFISSVNIPREGTQFATRDFFDAEVVKP